MSEESHLQVTPKGENSSLTLSKVRSGLVARGRRDAAILAEPSPPEPTDPLSETRRRAEEGNAWAQWSLGDAYDEGKGVPQDFAQAAMWYRKAAEQGCGPAQQCLGRLHRDGRGLPQNFAEALRWYLKAAACSPYGHEAKIELGLSYFDGIGVEQNYREAVKWFREAMPSIMGYAELYLGYAYANGHGVERDYTEAVRLWTIASDAEDLTAGNAHSVLGQASYWGHGVPRDLTLAYMWYALATAYSGGASTEHERNKSLRDSVAKLLTSQQLDEARRLARDWHAKRFGPDSEIDLGL